LQVKFQNIAIGNSKVLQKIHCSHKPKNVSLYLTSEYKEERSMLTMDTIKDIRFRYFVKGEKISQIAKTLNLDWRTVRKYARFHNFI